MRTITKTELNEILIKHKKWINNEVGGERADLRNANLRNADLRNARAEERQFVKTVGTNVPPGSISLLPKTRLWGGEYDR